MLRLLIRDITVEKLADARQIVMHVRWQGGACRDISVALPGSIADQLRYTPRMIERVRELSRELSDPQIVQALNQQGVRSSRGLPFTLAMIKWIRYRYGIASVCQMRPGELTVKQLAERLAVSIHFVHYWIKRGLIEARQLDGRGPLWVTVTDQQEQHLHEHVRTSAHLKDHHSNS